MTCSVCGMRGRCFATNARKKEDSGNFNQIGVEVLGSANPRADVEVIAIACDILQTLGLKNLRLDINSVGNKQDRQNYRQALIDYFTPSQRRIRRGFSRPLDSQSAADIGQQKSAHSRNCSWCAEHFRIFGRGIAIALRASAAYAQKLRN